MFSIGLILGAASSGLVLWLLSGFGELLPQHVAGGGLVVLAAAALLRDFGALRFRLPENRRLVPQTLFRETHVRAGLQFGFELGTGVRTYITSTSPYVVAAAVLLIRPSVTQVSVTAVGFGLGRAAMPWMRKVAPAKRQWDELLARRGKLILQVSSLGTFLAALAVVLS